MVDRKLINDAANINQMVCKKKLLIKKQNKIRIRRLKYKKLNLQKNNKTIIEKQTKLNDCMCLLAFKYYSLTIIKKVIRSFKYTFCFIITQPPKSRNIIKTVKID